jgi:branched-chain amino acid transport system permease protein
MNTAARSTLWQSLSSAWRLNPWVMFVLVAALPPCLSLTGAANLGDQLTKLFPLAILALALNVVVGYTGMLHLGIMAFFAIGAYTTGILVQTDDYPFGFGLGGALLAAPLLTSLAGVLLGAPTLRLRGDYLALVTLGFGEMVKDTLVNLDDITQGIQGINGIRLELPEWLTRLNSWGGWNLAMYYLNLAALLLVLLILWNAERSRLGRAWIAIREDELAASCMGIDLARTKLAAFALCAGIAGLGGCLFVFAMTSTTDPKNTYTFNSSIMILASVILGGMGNRYGVLLGVFLVFGFDQIVIPWIDQTLKTGGVTTFEMKDWKLLVYGSVLIFMMRFRPEGLLPEERIAQELHEERGAGA